MQNAHSAIAFSVTNQLFIRANQLTGAYCTLIAISFRVERSSPTNPEGNNYLQNEKKESLLHDSIACRGNTKGHAKLKCHRPRSLRWCDELTETTREYIKHRFNKLIKNRA